MNVYELLGNWFLFSEFGLFYSYISFFCDG